MSRYCVDTSAYGHFKRGDPQVTDLLDTAEWIGIPSVVLGELWTGFLAGGRSEENAAELEEFLGNPVVEEIPTERHVARLYAEILPEVRKAGRPTPTNDVWVAAAAARTGATVLTYDDHFRAIGRVGCHILGG